LNAFVVYVAHYCFVVRSLGQATPRSRWQ
jgi:hypothetical protein